MNIVLYGEEKLLLQQKLDKYQKQYDISQENMNLETYYATEVSLSEILEDALTPPFLTEYKMIIIKQPLFLTTTKQKDISQSDINMFIDYISHDNPSTILVIYHDIHNFDERKKVVKTLRQHATFIEVEKPTHHQLYKITRQSIIKRGCSIDDDALNLLIDRVGDSLLDVSQEVEKLCLYQKHITINHINELVTPRVEENVFSLTNAILSHDTSSTMKIYHDLIQNNNEPIALIGLVANSMRQLYLVKCLSRKGYRDQEIAKMTGINPRAIYPIRRNGESFELDTLLHYLEELSELDIHIKTGIVDKEKGLELFLLKI